MSTKVKSKRGKVFKPKGFNPSPYKIDQRRHGFALNSPKGVEISDEMCDRVLSAIESCSETIQSARINDDKRLIVTFKVIRPAGKVEETLQELISTICRTTANIMLDEAQAAKKRLRASQAAERSAKKDSRDTSYLNRSQPKPVTP